MRDAGELHDQAKQAFNSGAFARATRLLDRARDATDDVDLLARIELTRAYAEAETGHATEGIERCGRVLQVDDLSDETRGLAWAQLGLLRMRTGDSSRALMAFEAALDLLPAEHDELGAVFLNRGNVHLQGNDIAGAVADFTRAREELARVSEVEQAKAEHNLGYVRLLTGDIVGAIQVIDEAA